MFTDSKIDKKNKLIFKVPNMYNVIFHNDAATPQDYVVGLLVAIFDKDYFSAKRIMFSVHNTGEEIIGTYSYDIAQSKKTKADKLSNQFGFPLKITINEAIE